MNSGTSRALLGLVFPGLTMPGGLLVTVGAGMVPWSGYLIARGHRRWALFDLVQASVLTAGGLRLRRGRTAQAAAPWVKLSGGLLVLDAVVDVATSARFDVATTRRAAAVNGEPSDHARLPAAVAMAVLAELPLAALCWRIASGARRVRRAR